MNHRIFAVALVIAQASVLGVAADGPTIEWEIFNAQNGLIGDGCLHVFEDIKGNIWCTDGKRGVSKFDGTQWTNFRKEDGLTSKPIAKYYADSQGNVWLFDTLGRFSKYDGQQFIKGSKKRSVTSIFEDSKHNIWMGSSHIKGKMAGVFQYVDAEKDPDKFVRVSKKTKGLLAGKGNLVYVIFEDSNNILWFGKHKGVSTYDGSHWTSYDKDNGLTSKSVTGILEDKKGNVWVGTYDGLFRYDGRSWRRFTKEDGTLLSDDVLSLKMDADGNIWVSVGGHSETIGIGGIIGAVSNVVHKSGVLKFDGEEWVEFSGEEGSPPVTVSQIEIDSKDNIWCNSITKGIYLYDGVKWTKFSKKEGFYADNFYDFEEDSHGNIWLATGGGLLFFDGQDWTQYSMDNGLFTDKVYYVIEDSRGDIWIITPKAVGRYRR